MTCKPFKNAEIRNDIYRKMLEVILENTKVQYPYGEYRSMFPDLCEKPTALCTTLEHVLMLSGEDYFEIDHFPELVSSKPVMSLAAYWWGLNEEGTSERIMALLVAIVATEKYENDK